MNLDYEIDVNERFVCNPLAAKEEWFQDKMIARCRYILTEYFQLA